MSSSSLPLAPTAVTSTLLLVFLVDFGIQFCFFVYSAAYKTEQFYDVSGSLTYISCILVCLLQRNDGQSISALHPRQIITAALVLAWSVRLGAFLFERVLRVPDKRFDELKQSAWTFAVPWFLQVVWIFLTPLAVYVVCGNPASSQPSLSWSDGIGIAVWTFGWAVEVVADVQKQAFKSKHPQNFVNVGIWKWSRYANYNGEITLWWGMFILCARGFVEPWQWVTVISPIFVTFLIVCVSGIALSEKNAEKRYGKRADYQSYKATTSTFFLWPPRKVKSPASPSSGSESNHASMGSANNGGNSPRRVSPRITPGEPTSVVKSK